MSEDFDPSGYLRLPIVNVASAMSLARSLLTAAPKDAGPAVRKAARKLRAAATELQDTWLAKDRAERSLDPRPADKAMDSAIAALYTRLNACTMLPADSYPQAERARELVTTLFADGLKWAALSR